VFDYGSRGCCNCEGRNKAYSHIDSLGKSSLNSNWVEGFENGANTEVIRVNFKKRGYFKGQQWVMYRWRNLNCKIVNDPLQGTRWCSCIPFDVCGDLDKLVETIVLSNVYWTVHHCKC
jgi:hypothetical protein